MSELSIIEGNRLIAIFDGYREIKDYDGWEYAYTIHPTINVACVGDMQLQYHFSWDRLLPALKTANQRIKDAGWGTSIEKEAKMRLRAALNEVSNINIEAAHHCFVKFIQWYNSQKEVHHGKDRQREGVDFH